VMPDTRHRGYLTADEGKELEPAPGSEIGVRHRFIGLRNRGQAPIYPSS